VGSSEQARPRRPSSSRQECKLPEENERVRRRLDLGSGWWLHKRAYAVGGDKGD
jgi:hypothetical protein